MQTVILRGSINTVTVMKPSDQIPGGKAIEI